MNRAGRTLRRVGGWALASGLAAVAGLSVRDLAGTLAMVIILVGAVCWVLTDAARSERLAMLIGAWRNSSPQPTEALAEAAPARRRGGQATLAADSSEPTMCGASRTG